MPKPVVFARRKLPIVNDLAAFSAAEPISALTEENELLDADWFENKAVYRLTTDNFGFAARAGQITIVDLTEDNEIEDHRLVIALYRNKIFARRVLRFGGRKEMVALGSEAENPQHRRQSLILPANEVRLLKVVGILFERVAVTGVRDEAVLLEGEERLRGVEILFRVKGESALPLALDNQLVLGGPPISSADFASLEDSIVAISTSDQAYLKRIGAPVAKSYRLFESIGLLGDSLLLCTEEEIEASLPGIEAISSARRVLGVLY